MAPKKKGSEAAPRTNGVVLDSASDEDRLVAGTKILPVLLGLVTLVFRRLNYKWSFWGLVPRLS